jgi:hypothetical protein
MALNPNRHHWFLPESTLWNQIGTLNAELMNYKDMILFAQDSDAITVAGTGLLSRVMTYNGSYYILVVNPSAQTAMHVDIVWNNNGTAPATKFGPDLSGSAGHYQTNLSAYQVGLYQAAAN